MEQTQLLEQLGLDEKEAKTYLAILELGSSTIKPIADRAGLKRTSLYNFIDHLVELGLIAQTDIRGRTHYQALPPSRLVDLQRERLSSLESALPQFMSIFNVAGDKPRISYYEGPEQIKQLLWEETRCNQELLGIWSGQDVDDLVGNRELARIDKARIAAGIKIRVVRTRHKDQPFQEFGGGPGNLRELRYAPPTVEFSTSLSIYDTGKVSFVTSRKESFGILIESQEIYQMMKLLFEGLWVQSQP